MLNKHHFTVSRQVLPALHVASTKETGMSLGNKIQDFRALSVLIVDPANNVRGTIAAMLKQLGFVDIEQAAKLSHGLELLNNKAFDIVICEHQPPDVDGLALLSKVRSHKDTKNSAFLIISASLDQHTVVDAVKAGVSEFIVKPFSLKTFQQRLKRAITLPVKSQQTRSSAEEKPQDDLENTSILVVDDVPENIKVISEIIRHDYQVRAATSGEKALKMCLSKHPPDMVLLDIMMPDMDGLTVCKRLKSHPLTQHISVIFISAMDQTDDVVKGLALGAVDYITKPINPQILAARVKTHVKIARAHKTLREQVDLMVDYAQLRSDFDRVIQKDMKRPIKAIEDNLLKLDVYYDEPRKVRETTQKLKEVCSTANLYTENMALIDRLENKDYPFNPMPVNVVEAAKEAAKTLSAMAEARKIVVDINDTGLYIVQGEDSMVRMTFANLLKNAIEASPEQESIKIDFQLQGKSIVCRLYNVGVIPTAAQGHFFDKYFSWEKPQGCGLGTYAAKMLTETQQGNIWFESSQDDNTSLYLEYQRVT